MYKVSSLFQFSKQPTATKALHCNSMLRLNSVNSSRLNAVWQHDVSLTLWFTQIHVTRDQVWLTTDNHPESDFSLFLVSVPLKGSFLHYEHCIHALRSVYVLIRISWAHNVRAVAKLACMAYLFSVRHYFEVYPQVSIKFFRLCHTLCEVAKSLDDQKSFSQEIAYIKGNKS